MLIRDNVSNSSINRKKYRLFLKLILDILPVQLNKSTDSKIMKALKKILFLKHHDIELSILSSASGPISDVETKSYFKTKEIKNTVMKKTMQ